MGYIPDVVGTTGVVIILVAYFALQTQRVSATAPLFSISNAIGSGLILVSLCFNFNLASFLIEASWLLMSLYGLYRIFVKEACS